MASSFENGITFDLKALNWGEALAGVLDFTALRDAALETGDVMEDEIINNFEDRESSWKALAASTIQNRIRLGYQAGPILMMSGTLKDNVAANRDVTINGTEISIAVFPAEATAPYSNAPITEYAEMLNEIRPFYDFTDEQAEKIYDILEEKIAEKLGFI